MKARAGGRREAGRARMIDATLDTLDRLGYAGTTARAVAETGGFNQALIYYHFESLEALLIAALQDFSERRLVRYREALAGITSVAGIVEKMTRLYEDDLTGGRLAAAQAVVAGSAASPELGRRVVELMVPWFAFAEEVVGQVLRDTGIAELVPAKELAYALVALYFGVETLARLDGDRGKAQALFASGAQLAPLVDLVLSADVQLGDGG